MDEYLDKMNRTIKAITPFYKEVSMSTKAIPPHLNEISRSIKELTPCFEKVSLGPAVDIAFSKSLIFDRLKGTSDAVKIATSSLQNISLEYSSSIKDKMFQIEKSFEAMAPLYERINLGVFPKFDKNTLETLDENIEYIKSKMKETLCCDEIGSDYNYKFYDNSEISLTGDHIEESVKRYTDKAEKQTMSLLHQVYSNINKNNPDAKLLKIDTYYSLLSLAYTLLSIYICLETLDINVDIRSALIYLFNTIASINTIIDFMKKTSFL